MSSLDLSDQVVRRSVDVGHDVGLAVRVLLSSRVRKRGFPLADLDQDSVYNHQGKRLGEWHQIRDEVNSTSRK